MRADAVRVQHLQRDDRRLRGDPGLFAKVRVVAVAGNDPRRRGSHGRCRRTAYCGRPRNRRTSGRADCRTETAASSTCRDRSSCQFGDARIDDRDADARAVIAVRRSDGHRADGHRRAVVEAGGRTVIVNAENLGQLFELLQDAVRQVERQTVDDRRAESPLTYRLNCGGNCAPGTRLTITLMFWSPLALHPTPDFLIELVMLCKGVRRGRLCLLSLVGVPFRLLSPLRSGRGPSQRQEKPPAWLLDPRRPCV